MTKDKTTELLPLDKDALKVAARHIRMALPDFVCCKEYSHLSNDVIEGWFAIAAASGVTAYLKATRPTAVNTELLEALKEAAAKLNRMNWQGQHNALIAKWNKAISNATAQQNAGSK